MVHLALLHYYNTILFLISTKNNDYARIIPESLCITLHIHIIGFDLIIKFIRIYLAFKY